jgi:transmembrane sensor
MADVHRLPDVRKAEREASEWIARLNADDVSADEHLRFEVWRSAHPLHSRVYEELLDTWRQFTAAGPFVRAVSFVQSMNEAGAVREPRRRWTLAAAALSAVVVLLAGLYVERVTSDTRFKTAIGEQATISLPDGSSMELNSNSVARVDYSARSRVIRLERGEAFFKVAHDIRRPFWVVGGGSWVRAVGTAFNVDVRSAEVQVTVSEGTVKVGGAEPLLGAAPSDDALAKAVASVLTVGQQADLRGAMTITRKLSSAELARSVAWRDGTVYFENRPLSDVIDEMGRYTTLQLVVEDEKLRHLPVGGTFQANPQGAEALLTMLEQGFGVRVRREADRAYLRSAPDQRPQTAVGASH